eukprot:203954_1
MVGCRERVSKILFEERKSWKTFGQTPSLLVHIGEQLFQSIDRLANDSRIEALKLMNKGRFNHTLRSPCVSKSHIHRRIILDSCRKSQNLTVSESGVMTTHTDSHSTNPDWGIILASESLTKIKHPENSSLTSVLKKVIVHIINEATTVRKALHIFDFVLSNLHPDPLEPNSADDNPCIFDFHPFINKNAPLNLENVLKSEFVTDWRKDKLILEKIQSKLDTLGYVLPAIDGKTRTLSEYVDIKEVRDTLSLHIEHLIECVQSTGRFYFEAHVHCQGDWAVGYCYGDGSKLESPLSPELFSLSSTGDVSYGGILKPFCRPVRGSGTIGVLVDVNSGYIKFYENDEDIGIAFGTGSTLFEAEIIREQQSNIKNCCLTPFIGLKGALQPKIVRLPSYSSRSHLHRITSARPRMSVNFGQFPFAHRPRRSGCVPVDLWAECELGAPAGPNMPGDVQTRKRRAMSNPNQHRQSTAVKHVEAVTLKYVRKRTRRMFEDKRAPRGCSKFVDRLDDAAQREHAAASIQRWFHEMSSRRRNPQTFSQIVRAVVILRRAIRSWRATREHRMYLAVTLVQSVWRGFNGRKTAQIYRKYGIRDVERAAVVIQCLFRRLRAIKKLCLLRALARFDSQRRRRALARILRWYERRIRVRARFQRARAELVITLRRNRQERDRNRDVKERKDQIQKAHRRRSSARRTSKRRSHHTKPTPSDLIAMSVRAQALMRGFLARYYVRTRKRVVIRSARRVWHAWRVRRLQEQLDETLDAPQSHLL